ncbi:MAG: hypothetical protein IKN75_10880 [Prevotella sp.]|nr:hypothetical protein [Prevotella sp.]
MKQKQLLRTLLAALCLLVGTNVWAEVYHGATADYDVIFGTPTANGVTPATEFTTDNSTQEFATKTLVITGSCLAGNQANGRTYSFTNAPTEGKVCFKANAKFVGGSYDFFSIKGSVTNNESVVNANYDIVQSPYALPSGSEETTVLRIFGQNIKASYVYTPRNVVYGFDVTIDITNQKVDYIVTYASKGSGGSVTATSTVEGSVPVPDGYTLNNVSSWSLPRLGKSADSYYDNVAFYNEVPLPQYSYAINAVAGGTTISTFTSGTTTSGSSYNAYIPEIITYNSQYYRLSDANINSYFVEYQMGTEAATQEINYTLDENITAFWECENLSYVGHSWYDGGAQNNQSACSGGKAICPYSGTTNGIKTSSTIGKGTYNITIKPYRWEDKATTYTLQYSTDNENWTDIGNVSFANNSNDATVVENVIIPSDSYLRLMSPGGTPRHALDYILVEKITETPVCAAPTFTIGSYNYEEEGYAITPSCTTEGATLTYKIGNGADTECTNGVPFYAKEGKLVITASKNGWESASTPTESQYTLNVAPSSTSPETLIPFVTGSDKGDKDLLHTYKSVSIPGTYFAGIDGNNGLKLRCGKKTSSIEGVNNDFVLNVNPCYKVTKVQFSSLKSNRAAEITVDAMYVDGEAVDGFTSFNIPANSESVISKEYTDLSATSQIVWKLTPGKYTDGNTEKDVDQFRATITVTYEANTIPASISKYGYVTFSSTYALDFTDVNNAKAYIVTHKSGNSIKLQEVTGKVAAGTGLILKSNNGGEANVTIPATNETGEYYNTNTNPINYLFAVNSDYELGAGVGGTNYVLTVQDEKVVFASIGSTTAAVKTGQAALWIPESAGTAKALTLSFADDITGINEVGTIEPKAGKIYYNLQGQRVSEPKEGIYVVEGKKVLVNKMSH